jgi:S1-C subfamily serine protease
LEIPGTSQPVRRPVPRPEVRRPQPGERGDGPDGDPRRQRAAAPPAEGAPALRKERRRVGLVALVLTVALASGLAGGVVGVVASRNPDLFGGGATASGTTAGQAATAVPQGTSAGHQLQQVLAAVLPAVVKIEARSDNGKATGSGIIFNNNGYVLTNAHVIEEAQTISVTLSTSEPLRARFVGRDLNYDLAVLKVRRTGLTTAKVGRAADLQVGDAAIVIGSPFGFQSSVTTGIVSALHRVVKVPDSEDGGEGRELVDAIQTDAAINPGNSGGALANGNGEVVGISTAIATNSGGEANAGVGFAIPIDAALEVARSLVKRRPVDLPFLGVEADTELSPEIVDRYRLGNHAGALVTRVAPRGPAAEAGLRRGDLIVRLGDQAIPARDQLTVAERGARIGVPVPVTVVRRGRELILQITPTERPGR